MKTATAVLCLWLAASQTVAFSNCCKGVFCSEKDECPPCGSDADPGRACCEADAPASGSDQERTPCVHVEPSSDVVQDDASLKLGPAWTSVALEAAEGTIDVEESLGRAFAPGVDPPRRPKRVPLFLLDSVLLI